MLNYLERIVKWLFQGKFHLSSLVVVIIAINYLIGSFTFSPVYVASYFTISGLFIILTQQLLDAKQFSDYNPNTIGNWIKGFPKTTPVVHNVSSNISLTLTEKAHLSVIISDDAPLERKVAHLLKEVSQLDKRINQITDKIEENKSEFSNKTSELNGSINRVNNVLNSLIAGHIVGSYDINFFGIIITLCGTIIQIFKAATP